MLAIAIAPTRVGAQFIEHTVTTDIRFGYQVLITDLNRDERPDLIALGARMSELLWFENPGWERHVIASDLSGMINMDAADIDGDGTPELGLAYGYSVIPSRSVGNIAILKHAGDPTRPWMLTEIDALPASHRIRFGRIDGGGPVLINAPILHADADGFADPERLATPLVFYRPGDWMRETITDENEGVVHGLLPWDSNGDGREEVLTAGRLGVHAHSLDASGNWSRVQLTAGEPAPYPDGGSSDLGAGRLDGKLFFTAIEPFHGNQVVVYRQSADDDWERLVIDTELVSGHSLLVADLNGDGNSEIVAAGTRGPKNLYLYRATDETGNGWERSVMDGAISANSCAAGDINGDGLTDVACLDSAAPFSLKWYENTSDWSAPR